MLIKTYKYFMLNTFWHFKPPSREQHRLCDHPTVYVCLMMKKRIFLGFYRIDVAAVDQSRESDSDAVPQLLLVAKTDLTEAGFWFLPFHHPLIPRSCCWSWRAQLLHQGEHILLQFLGRIVLSLAKNNEIFLNQMWSLQKRSSIQGKLRSPELAKP